VSLGQVALLCRHTNGHGSTTRQVERPYFSFWKTAAQYDCGEGGDPL
jgi:hypothetical protein